MKRLFACVLAAVALIPTTVLARSGECIDGVARVAYPSGEGPLQLPVGDPIILQGFERVPSYTLHLGDEVVVGTESSVGTMGWAVRLDLPEDLGPGDVLELDLEGDATHVIELVAATQAAPPPRLAATLCDASTARNRNTVRVSLDPHPHPRHVLSMPTNSARRSSHLVPPGAAGDLWLPAVLDGGCLDLVMEDASTGEIATQRLCDATPCAPPDPVVPYTEDATVALDLNSPPPSYGACFLASGGGGTEEASCTVSRASRPQILRALFVRRWSD